MEKDIWKKPQQEKTLDESQSPLWFWNDKLENEELLRQLKMKTDVGVKCTIPHARMNNGDGYIGGYLDEDWFEKTRTVLEYKKANDETMWLYDEMDWPAGTCNKTLTLDENNRERYLSFQKFEIPAGEVFRAQLKELHGKNLAGLEDDVDLSDYAFNVYIADAKTGKPYSVADYIIKSYIGSVVDFKSDADAVAYIVTIHVDSYDSWGAGCVNYLDADVTKKFVDSTYEKYYEQFGEYFSNTIKCVFNDETRMANAFPWMKSFAEDFEKRKGYDFLLKVFDLILPGVEAGRTRCDYFDVVAELFQQNFLGILGDWSRAHGIKFYAHLLGEETLASQVRYSGDFMRQMRYLDVGGVDHLGKGIGSLNIKFASTAARSYGKTRTAVEVFAGCGWGLTFEEYIRMISWMFQQGMQIIINHGFFYSTRDTRKNDWPPSQFFQWQGWDRMAEGNAMVRRLHYALTDGVPENEVLLYHPVESFWLEYIGNENYKHGYDDGPRIDNEKARKLDMETQLLYNELLCNNLDFELLHRDALENFKVSDGKIVNETNGQKFSVFVLPMCRVITKEALELAKEFVNAGGKLFVVGDCPEYAMDKSQDEDINRLMEEIKQSPNAEFLPIAGRTQLCKKINELIDAPVVLTKGGENNGNDHPYYGEYLIDPYRHNGEDLSGVRFVRYKKDSRRNSFFMNYDNVPKEVEVVVKSVNEPEVWDTFTGEIQKPEIIEFENNTYKVRFTLPCNYGVILVSDL